MIIYVFLLGNGQVIGILKDIGSIIGLIFGLLYVFYIVYYLIRRWYKSKIKGIVLKFVCVYIRICACTRKYDVCACVCKCVCVGVTKKLSCAFLQSFITNTKPHNFCVLIMELPLTKVVC